MDWRCKRHYVKKYFRLLYLEQNIKQARTDDPLAEFSFFPHQRLQVSEKFSFQELSTKECARLCLQVTKQLIFNCSSFEYEVAANDCFLMGSFCLHHQLIYDGFRDYYELKGKCKVTGCVLSSDFEALGDQLYQKHQVIIKSGLGITLNCV